MTEDIQRLLGEHNAKIDALLEDVKRLQEEVRCIHRLLDEARGGWKTLILISGTAGIVGAGITKLFQWFPFR